MCCVVACCIELSGTVLSCPVVWCGVLCCVALYLAVEGEGAAEDENEGDASRQDDLVMLRVGVQHIRHRSAKEERDGGRGGEGREG